MLSVKSLLATLLLCASTIAVQAQVPACDSQQAKNLFKEAFDKARIEGGANSRMHIDNITAREVTQPSDGLLVRVPPSAIQELWNAWEDVPATARVCTGVTSINGAQVNVEWIYTLHLREYGSRNMILLTILNDPLNLIKWEGPIEGVLQYCPTCLSRIPSTSQKPRAADSGRPKQCPSGSRWVSTSYGGYCK